MKTINRRLQYIALIVAFGLGLRVIFAKEADAESPSGADPETIYCVSSVRSGKESAYADLQAKAWAIYRRLDLVMPKPHLLIRGTDGAGKTYFVEIFTWRESSIPDNAPKEVRDIWSQLEATCEPRAGRPGIDFSEGGVTVLEND